MSVKIASYNILSHDLSSPSWFSQLDPNHCNPEIRFPKIVNKLECEMKHNTIFCLQEIGERWAGPLSSFFEKNNYTFLYSGWKSSLGVGIAFPRQIYSLNRADIKTIGKTRRWCVAPKSLWYAWAESVGKRIPIVRNLFIDDPWRNSLSRENTTIAVELTNKTGHQFCVATYHMPCAFWDQRIMIIHTSMIGQYVQNFANGVPYILAGDFNFKPSEDGYKLLTTGSIQGLNHVVDVPKDTRSLDLSIGMESAYGQEPEWTNWTIVKKQPTFKDCIDYIFLSPHDWHVTDVMPLPNCDGPFPNESEPSDHIMIGCTLELF